MIKLLYHTIKINDPDIIPMFDPNTGIIFNKNTTKEIYRIAKSEPNQYFNFTIEFGGYQYAEIYQPSLLTYQKRIISKQYHLYLNINIAALSKLKFGKFLDHIVYRLIIIQKRELETKKRYDKHSEELAHFIDYREKNPLYLIPWNQFIINHNYAFDLRRKRLLTAQDVSKFKFSKKGGIIETNNVRKVVKHFQKCEGKTLVILPSNMTNLWSDCLLLPYEKFLSMSSSDTTYYQKKRIDRIIIHECYVQFLSHLKKFLHDLNCDKIWIINSLPLRYYFAEKETPKKLNINNLEKLNNLWLAATLFDRKKHKTAIIRFLFSKFNQLYFRVNYDSKAEYPKIKLAMNPLEKNIHQSFQQYYDNWKNKLTNDPKNIYSIATKEKINMIGSKVYASAINLMTSVKKMDNIPIFFKKKTKKCLIKIQKMASHYTNLAKIYQSGMSIFNVPLSILHEKKKQTELMLSNYRKYSSSDVYQNFRNDNCPVCFSTDELVKVQLICGHTICLECIIHVLARTNSCPVCSEFINISKIAIIHETIPNYFSEIMDYLEKLDDETIILTDFDLGIKNVINVTTSFVSNKIKKIKNVKNIILFFSSKGMKTKIQKEITHIINYFTLLNTNPHICSLEMV